MKVRGLQLFLLITPILACSSVADASDRKNYALKFADVDGHQLSTTDGPVHVLVFVTSGELNRAELVGDRIPDFCLGNPSYRMVTIVETGDHSGPIRLAFDSIARRRLDAAAKRLQARYDNHKIARVARQDVFAAIDFAGAIAANFTNQSDAATFRVVVLGPGGELRGQWTELPTTEQLTAALKRDSEAQVRRAQ